MDKCVDGKRKLINRLLSYGLGIVILALGITLNTKTGLGVSALVSIAYTVANAWNLNFALMTFLLYTCFALIEVGLKWGFLPQLRKVLWKDLLQIPFSLTFSLLLNVFGGIIPVAEHVGAQIVMLVLVIVCTGIGAAMIGVGRVVALFNRCFETKPCRTAGVEKV